jgi:hypothetical protein
MAESQHLTKQMQKLLEELGVPLTVALVPQPQSMKHGEIDQTSKTLFIYDTDPEQAWTTFIHEILEFKLQNYTRVYRAIINALIEALEKTAYAQKEEFLNFCLELMEKLRK